jgi:hypothetical protein
VNGGVTADIDGDEFMWRVHLPLMMRGLAASQ